MSITDRCGHETGAECICNQRVGCSLFQATKQRIVSVDSVGHNGDRTAEIHAEILPSGTILVTECWTYKETIE